MALVNPDIFTTSSGVQIANTYVVLGSDRVIFSVNPTSPPTFTASTNMQIYRDADAHTAGLVPVDVRYVSYVVPDASAVYNLLYGSAKASEGWANAFTANS